MKLTGGAVLLIACLVVAAAGYAIGAPVLAYLGAAVAMLVVVAAFAGPQRRGASDLAGRNDPVAVYARQFEHEQAVQED